MLSFLNKNQGFSLPIVLGLIAVMGISYVISENKMLSTKRSHEVLNLNLVENNVRSKVGIVCSSLAALRQSFEEQGQSYNAHVNACFTQSSLSCSQGEKQVTFLSSDQSMRLTGTSNCPAFYDHNGNPVSKGSNFENCQMEFGRGGFKVTSKAIVKCPSNIETCQFAEKVEINCSVEKIMGDTTISTWSENYLIGSFVCSKSDEAVIGIDGAGRLICHPKNQVIGVDGERGPSGDALTGPEGPIGDYYTSTRKQGVNTGCFVEGTLIETSLGSVPIENIGKQDLIYNPITNSYQKVQEKSQGYEKKALLVITTHAGLSVQVTEDHPMLSENIVEAQLLQVGDRIRTLEGWETIKSIGKQRTESFVYNLRLMSARNDDSDHFIVGSGIITGDLYLQRKLKLNKTLEENKGGKK